MQTFKFKTNFSCGGCVATVSGFLDDVEGLINWEADLVTDDKVLTVELENGVDAQKVIEAVEEAGFDVEFL